MGSGAKRSPRSEHLCHLEVFDPRNVFTTLWTPYIVLILIKSYKEDEKFSNIITDKQTHGQTQNNRIIKSGSLDVGEKANSDVPY